MLNLPIARVLAALQKLAELQRLLAERPADAPPEYVLAYYEDSYADLRASTELLVSDWRTMGMTVTSKATAAVADLLAKAEHVPPLKKYLFSGVNASRLLVALQRLHGCMEHESELVAAMVLPADKIDLYSPSAPLFGDEVRDKFPAAAYDLDEAAKCLALGRSTATVFHLMRCLEVVLKAVALCIAAKTPRNPNWGTWLDAIRNERDTRGTTWTEKDLFQDLWQRLDAIREAQRNSTMHIERVYTDEEARNVFEATRSFMKRVASRMDEKGLPLA